MNINNLNLFIREMKISDHSQLLELWNSIDGLSLDEEDLYDNMITFLNRNIGLSFVALCNDKIIGSIKGAQDGRRGYISHMAILPKFRGQGIAKVLINKTLKGLLDQGIRKCNLYVLDSNPDAYEFWKHNGWSELNRDFKMLQRVIVVNDI